MANRLTFYETIKANKADAKIMVENNLEFQSFPIEPLIPRILWVLPTILEMIQMKK